MIKILTVVISVFTLSLSAQEIKFDKLILDYGKIKINSDGSRIFKFKNIGDAPLSVICAITSSSNSIGTPPKNPILPGEVGEIKVYYDTNRPGVFCKSIVVRSNAKNKPRIVLAMKGYVANKI